MWQHPEVSLGTSQVLVDGSREMRVNRRGRVVARVVMVVAIVAVVVAGIAALGESPMHLTEILWSYSGQ